MDPSECNRLSKASREAVQLYQKVIDAGGGSDINWLQKQMPRIGVIGKQSCGKSSVLTAVTGVQLPSDMGTCTKCIIQINSKHSSENKVCSFQLRYSKDDSTGEDLGETKVVEKDEMTLDEGSWSMLPTHLRELQQEILKGSDGKQNLHFTANTIVLNISGPDCHDITIIDIPGMIQNDDSNGRDVNAVMSMVTDFVRAKNSVIVVCMPCDDDVDNQSALKVAFDVDPHGERTVGVLTKPDRIENCGDERILAIMKGKCPKARLKRGWFMLRCPTPLERRDDPENKHAIENELSFFANEVGHRFSEALPNRCGSGHLIKYIGDEIIAPMVHDKIFLIHPAMAKAVDESKNKLAKMGRQIEEADVQDVLLDKIRDVREIMEERISPARDGERSTWQKIKAAFLLSRDEVRKTMPTFTFEGSDAKFPSASLNDNMLTVGQVDDIVKAGRGREIFPGSDRNWAFKQLLRQCVSPWEQTARTCIIRVRALLEALCKEVLRDSVGEEIELFTRMAQILKDLVKAKELETEKDIAKLLRMHGTAEPRSKFRNYCTVHTDEMDAKVPRYEEEIRALLEPQHESERLQKARAIVEHAANSVMNQASKDAMINEISKHMPRVSDRVDPAVPKIMAEVIAYFEVSQVAFADMLARTVDENLLMVFLEELEPTLRKELGVLSEPKASLLRLVCDEETVERRASLLSELRRREGALDAVTDYMAEHNLVSTRRVPIASMTLHTDTQPSEGTTGGSSGEQPSEVQTSGNLAGASTVGQTTHYSWERHIRALDNSRLTES